MSSWVQRQEPYMKVLFKGSSAPHRPAQLLQHVNKDQINAVSELVLNTLKNNIPLTPRKRQNLIKRG